MPDLSTFLRQSSLTYSDIQRDCYNYINSLPEGSKPKDFFAGSEGKIIVDYLSAFHSDIAYKLIVAFCENFLIYANKIENILANAESKGFNASRGFNTTLKITFIPNQSTSIGYLDQVGTLEDFGLYSLESKIIVEGVSTTLNIVVGNLLSDSITIENTEAPAYRFTSKNVTDNIRIKVDGQLVDISTDPLDTLSGKLVTMTNAFGSVDVMDFSSIDKDVSAPINRNYKIVQGTILTLEYIELSSINYNGAIGDFYIGLVQNIVQTSTGIQPMSAVDIQRRSILYQQTKNRIVARRDAKKIILQHLPYILSTNDIDYSPSTIAISYVQENHLPLNDEQYLELINYLSECRTFGIPMPYIVGSNAINIKLNVKITTESIIGQATLQSMIKSVFSQYENQCGVILNFAEIEKQIEDITDVQTVRFIPVTGTFDILSYTELGQTSNFSYMQTSSDLSNSMVSGLYMAVDYLYRTGKTEPAWSTTLGSITVDNEIYWKAIPYQAEQLRQPNEAIAEYQIRNATGIFDCSFQAIQVAHKTGPQIPTGPGYTGDIYLSKTFRDSSKPDFTINSQMNYGNIVNLPGDQQYSYICSGFRKNTGSLPPFTGNTYVESANIKYVLIPMAGNYINKTATIELPWNAYAVFDLVVS